MSDEDRGHHEMGFDDALAESRAEIASLRAENERLRAKLAWVRDKIEKYGMNGRDSDPEMEAEVLAFIDEQSESGKR